MNISDNYIRDARVTSVYDGDTITAMVSLGYDQYRRNKFRFKGVNTAEMRGSTGARLQLAKDAKAYVEARILDKDVRILSERFEVDGYGRYLATIYYNDNGTWVNLNEDLLAKGLAQIYYPGASKDFGEWHK